MGTDAWDFDENTPVEANRQTPPSDTCSHCGHYHRPPTSSNLGRCGVPMTELVGGYRRCRCRGEAPLKSPSLEGLFWAAPNRRASVTIHAFLPGRSFGLCGRGGCYLEGDVIFDITAEMRRRHPGYTGQRWCLWCDTTIRGVEHGTRTELPT